MDRVSGFERVSRGHQAASRPASVAADVGERTSLGCFGFGQRYRFSASGGADVWASRWRFLSVKPQGFVEFSREVSSLPLDLRGRCYRFAVREGSRAHHDIRDAFAALGGDGATPRMIKDVLQDGHHAELLGPILTLIKYRLIDMQSLVPVTLPASLRRGGDWTSRASFLHRIAIEGRNPEPEPYRRYLHHPDRHSSLEERFGALARCGVPLDLPDRDGFTPLHYAVSEDNCDAIQALIAAGANLEARSRDRQTPLLLAVRSGANNALELLLDAGADISARYPGEPTAGAMLVVTAYTDAEDFYIRDIERPRPIADDDWTALHWAAALNTDASSDSLRLLLRHRADPNALSIDKETPLHVVCRRRGDSNKVRRLLRFGAGPHLRNVAGYNPLHLAAKWNAASSLKWLLQVGMNPNDVLDAERGVPLSLALKFYAERAAVELVRAGAVFTRMDVNLAAEHGMCDLVRLMASKSDFDFRGNDGFKPLIHAAAVSRSPEMVRLVVQELGVPVNMLAKGPAGDCDHYYLPTEVAIHGYIYDTLVELGGEPVGWPRLLSQPRVYAIQ